MTPDKIQHELQKTLKRLSKKLRELSDGPDEDAGVLLQKILAECEFEGFTYVLVRSPQLADIKLTLREREIAALVKAGMSNKAIAYKLGISQATVAVHLQRMFRKLNIDSRVALAQIHVQP